MSKRFRRFWDHNLDLIEGLPDVAARIGSDRAQPSPPPIP
jgi:hypothetical protein